MSEANDRLEDLRSQLSNARRKEIKVPLTCGSCSFFNKGAIYGQPCAKMGVLSDENPCGKYFPDIRHTPIDADIIYDSVAIAGSLDARQLDILIALLVMASKETKKKKNEFKFGDIVHYRVLQKDYINNYVCGTIIGSVKSGSDLNYMVYGRGIVAQLLPASLITDDQWKVKKEALEKKGLIDDPSIKVKKVKGRLQIETKAGPKKRGRRS